MSAGLVQHWLQTGRLHLPFPAAGHTEQRWRQLAELAAEDIVAARIAESHVDAAAILHELGAKPPEPEQLWAVWTAESSGATLAATGTGDDFVLHGTKQWCAGAGFCTHALVTAQLGIGPRVLMAVAVTGTGVRALPSRWWNPGMAGADIRAVQFTGAPAVLIGGPGDYWNRPGLWHGAAGQAACWLGGARAVAALLYQYAETGSLDPYALAHLGAVDAALTAADAVLAQAAEQIDNDPLDLSNTAQLTARRCRAVAEHAAGKAISRTTRALGSGPLCEDELHARRVADLSIYLSQSHAERDLAALGRLARQSSKQAKVVSEVEVR